jgi:uncharacterized membrane protein YozB (DUF420 family)
MDISDLSTVNASLNATSAVLLWVGRRHIARGRVQSHKRFMLAAFGVSTAFLVSYVIYHLSVGSKPFPGHGLLRGIYLTILISHVLLAFTVPPLAITTLYFALRARFDKHRRIARVTYPIWMYVSVTGVIVYLMLYHLAL